MNKKIEKILRDCIYRKENPESVLMVHGLVHRFKAEKAREIKLDNRTLSALIVNAVVNELGKLKVTKQEAIKIYQESIENGVLTLTKEQTSLLLDVINDGIPTRNINRNLLENVYIGNKTYSSIVEDTYKASI